MKFVLKISKMPRIHPGLPYSVYTNIHITCTYMYMYMAYLILPHQLVHVHVHVAIRKFLVKLQPFLIIMGVARQIEFERCKVHVYQALVPNKVLKTYLRCL